MPHIFFLSDGGQHEHLSEISRIMGGIVMSAQIIPFVRDRRRDRVRNIGSRSLATPDDLVMDHVDTAPGVSVRPEARPEEFRDG